VEFKRGRRNPRNYQCVMKMVLERERVILTFESERVIKGIGE